MEKIENFNQDDSTNRQQQQHEEKVEENIVNIDDLPSEILKKILRFVDTRSLFPYRLVSRKWLLVCTDILHFRPESIISFRFGSGHILQYSIRTKKESLKDFIQAFKESQNCPFARFRFFTNLPTAPQLLFDHEDWIEFFSVFCKSTSNSRIKFLTLDFKSIDKIKDVLVLTEKVKDLLLNKIPDLEEFGLDLAIPFKGNTKEIQLFSSQNTETTTKFNPIHLDHLKVLHLYSKMFSNYPRIVEEFLRAAVNLKRISPSKSDPYFFTNHFPFLYTMGKLHLVEQANIRLNAEFLAAIKPIIIQMAKNPHSPPLFNLKELNLCVDSIFTDNSIPKKIPQLIWNDATHFISLLFESSKNSLRKLTLCPLGFLSGLEFPRFSNVTELTLLQRPVKDLKNLTQLLPRQFFPRGVKSRDIFPAVRILNFTTNAYDVNHTLRDWSAGFLHNDSIPCLPLVEDLIVKAVDSRFTGKAVANLALMCPNLKNFNTSIQEKSDWPNIRPQARFLDVGRAIWTHMKQLESLEMDVHVTELEKNSNAFDLWFTGLCEEDFQRLRELKEADKLLKNWGSKAHVPEFEMKAERKYASILDMKGMKTCICRSCKELKKLTLRPFSREFYMVTKFFTSNLSWISEEFVFKFVPHLNPILTE